VKSYLRTCPELLQVYSADKSNSLTLKLKPIGPKTTDETGELVWCVFGGVAYLQICFAFTLAMSKTMDSLLASCRLAT